jgi:hypothetical protein
MTQMLVCEQIQWQQKAALVFAQRHGAVQHIAEHAGNQTVEGRGWIARPCFGSEETAETTAAGPCLQPGGEGRIIA